MKWMTVFALVLSTQAVAGEEVLLKVDELLAKDSYEAAFKCGDSALEKSRSRFGTEVYDYSTVTSVKECGAATVIESRDSEDAEDTWTETISESQYKAGAGNPLRIFDAARGMKIQESRFDWESATARKIRYLGKKRNALDVKGRGEVCFEDEENHETCLQAEVTLTIVQGVPFLARMTKSSIVIPAWDLSATNNISSFNRIH
jgi:hypothetical protein